MKIELRLVGPVPEGRIVLTKAEAATALGRSIPTLNRYIDRGIVPAERLSERRTVIPVAGLMEAVARG